MGKRKPPDLRRRAADREPRRVFLLFCEGENTEPRYFDALKRSLPNALIHVESVRAAGVPRTIADKAVEALRQIRRERKREGANSFEEKDEVWAVFDRDEHPHFDDAVAACESGDVRVARSNPCFEVWLILHEQNHHAPDGRKQVQALYRRLHPEYDPDAGKVPDCMKIVSRVEDAERRAEDQLRCREEEGRPFGIPSTTVGRLTRQIRLAADASRRK